jgi:hypothetical protein
VVANHRPSRLPRAPHRARRSEPAPGERRVARRRRDDGTQAARDPAAGSSGRAEEGVGAVGAARRRRKRCRRARGHPDRLPAQHLKKPGHEAELEPQFLAPDYRGSGKLDGFAAIVTGGDSGIGRAVAVLFAREGADVTVAYLDEHDDAAETERCIEAEGRRCSSPATSSRRGSPRRSSRRRSTRSAGSTSSSTAPASRSTPTRSTTSPTKGAIHAFTKSLAQSLLDKGIRVNAVAPGPVWTPLNPADSPAEKVAAFGRTRR